MENQSHLKAINLRLLPLTRFVIVLLKKILYSLQILTKSVPNATTNAKLVVQLLA